LCAIMIRHGGVLCWSAVVQAALDMSWERVQLIELSRRVMAQREAVLEFGEADH
jgi:hypothetical protein